MNSPKPLLFALACLLCLDAAPQMASKKYGAPDLLQELDFVQNQIYNVHANPWTEIDQKAFDREVEKIRQKLTDPLTAYAFMKQVRPLFSWLSDEHADIDVNDSIARSHSSYCLPFSLQRRNGKTYIDTLLGPSDALMRGTEILSVEGVPIEQLLERCAAMATGYPDQRLQKALAQFGFLYHLACEEKVQYTVVTASGTEIRVSAIGRSIWDTYIYPGSKKSNVPVDKRISYAKYGSMGYITASSFTVRGEAEMDRFDQVIDSIFHQIRKDEIDELIIDVSNNPGGNSAVGNMLIAQFYRGEIRSYQSTTKRSDEYLRLLKSWGIENPDYESHEPGEIIFRPAIVSKTMKRRNFFKGKVYVVIGARTFSSAIMFATLIKDNKITPLIGEKPANGHPTHFGEMYNTTSPILGLKMRFGIKEWIRPAGKEGVNELIPDIAFSLAGVHKPEDVIALLNAHR